MNWSVDKKLSKHSATLQFSFSLRMNYNTEWILYEQPNRVTADSYQWVQSRLENIVRPKSKSRVLNSCILSLLFYSLFLFLCTATTTACIEKTSDDWWQNAFFSFVILFICCGGQLWQNITSGNIAPCVSPYTMMFIKARGIFASRTISKNDHSVQLNGFSLEQCCVKLS